MSSDARTVERLTLVTGRLGRQLGAYPRMNWRLIGEQSKQAAGRPVAEAVRA